MTEKKRREHVPDGIWDITGIEYFEDVSHGRYVKQEEGWRIDPINPNFQSEKEAFIEKYPDYVIADPYQTEHPFLLSKMPEKQVSSIGSGFNYGSNNIVIDCPATILICAQDD